MPAYYPTKAIAYAKKWASGYNPGFRYYGGAGASGDCTNFVSQCLYFGGWPMITGSNFHTRYDRTVWYYNISENQIRGEPCSRSWAGAPEFAEFCWVSGRASLVYDGIGLKGALPVIEPGDVIQHGGPGPNGFLSHTMFVTHVDKTDRHKSEIHQHGAHPSRILNEDFCRAESGNRVLVWHPARVFTDVLLEKPWI